MTVSTKKISPIVMFGAWLLSFIVFIVGFWHTHLGLKEIRPFGSEYGSLLIAGIILLLILISYNIAINGRKNALVFYVIGGLFFFIFNLNYFYPSYLGRKLINEETDQIKDSLTVHKNELNTIAQVKQNSYIKTLNDLTEIKENILTEILDRGGFGNFANDQLDKFKKLTDSELTGERQVVKDEKAIGKLYADWDKKLQDAINNYIATTIPGSDKNKLQIVYTNYELDQFYKKYKPVLDSISNDDRRIVLDSLKFENYRPSKQIKTLKIVTDKINQTKVQVNTALNQPSTPFFSKEYPKSKYLGKFEHTLSSIKERINKIDTWGIIILCLFIDLLVPLFIYMMIRRKDGEGEYPSNVSFWGHITGKEKPSTF